jgi:hypothetical protein
MMPKIGWEYQSGKYIYYLSGFFGRKLFPLFVDKICIRVDLPYITNEFCKNVLNVSTP